MAKKKKKNAKKLVLGVLVAYVAIMALGYMGVSYYFSSHFLKGTTISGIDCSSKTATQVKKKIQKQLGQYKLRNWMERQRQFRQPRSILLTWMIIK